MRAHLRTYYLRKWINAIVESTETSPSLAEMMREHLEVDWARLSAPPYEAIYAVHNKKERLIELRVVDARSYLDDVYRRGWALLRIGVNGALTTPEEEAEARAIFATDTFRSCRICHARFASWLEYYGHVKLAHLGVMPQAS
ncbi:MAG: hypothetical protein K6U14_09540 [Firmicutes bacterium]|nr:hypothetical protein [Alicyclobacillaceae bacterium]MCL6497855.1 hypothetical protein [Bacillota bacterium]